MKIVQRPRKTQFFLSFRNFRDFNVGKVFGPHYSLAIRENAGGAIFEFTFAYANG